MSLAHRSLYVALNGDQDIAHRDDLRNALPEPGPHDSLIIDCRNVFYMDSVAMGVLVKYRGRFVEAGARAEDLMLIAPSGSSVRRLFDIAGLARVFTILDHLPEELYN